MKNCPFCGGIVEPQDTFCPHCGENMVADLRGAKAIASVWPQWQVTKLLGKGSYGSVYSAIRTQSTLQTTAAIKVISLPFDNAEISSLRAEGLDQTAITQYYRQLAGEFLEEAKVMESLKGVQNIVSVEDCMVFQHPNDPGCDICIRMELLTPFTQYIENRTLTQEEVIQLGIDLCSALELCHGQKVIHRDIKPENIFVNHFGHFKLGDFGIARTLENTTSGLSQKGTFNYMAPEVAFGRKYDHRVDIYSLGLTLYRLLNNNLPPFLPQEQRLSPLARKQALDRRLQGETLPPPAMASAQLARVILTATAFDPNGRYASATAMKQALLQAKATLHLPVAENPYDATFSVRKAPAPAQKPMATPPKRPMATPPPRQVAPKPAVSVATAPSSPTTAAIAKKKTKKKKKDPLGTAAVKIMKIVVILLLVASLTFGGYMVYFITSQEASRGEVDTEQGVYTNQWANLRFDFSDYSYGTETQYKNMSTEEITCVLYVSALNANRKLTIAYGELDFWESIAMTEREYTYTATPVLQFHNGGVDTISKDYSTYTLAGEKYTALEHRYEASFNQERTELLLVRKQGRYMICISAVGSSLSDIEKMLEDFS